MVYVLKSVGVKICTASLENNLIAVSKGLIHTRTGNTQTGNIR